MTARTPNGTPIDVLRSVATLLDDIEMPNSPTFADFEEQFGVRLAELEMRFRDYVTRDSFVGSIGRPKGTTASSK